MLLLKVDVFRQDDEARLLVDVEGPPGVRLPPVDGIADSRISPDIGVMGNDLEIVIIRK